MKALMLYKIVTILYVLLCVNTVYCQESDRKDQPKERSNQGFVIRFSEQDLIIPITSIEWGHPDRWSLTSRYIHGFNKERKRRTWDNNIGIVLCPGLSGGRLGVNYLGIYSPASLREFAIFIELRSVLLHTWGNPLSTSANTTFTGAELKICISWLINFGIGYYTPIQNSNETINPFWGFHIGIGI